MNREELANLVGAHQAQIFRYLRYLGAQDAVAEDLAQETFLVAFDGRTLPAGPVTAAWLRGVARNLFLAHCRRQRNAAAAQVGSESLEEAEAVWAPWFPEGVGGEDYLAALRECLKGLPAREREMVDMQYARGASRAEMALAGGLTEDGVKSLMRRIRAKLAACVAGRLRRGDGTC